MIKEADERSGESDIASGNWLTPIALDANAELPPFPTDALPLLGSGVVKMVSQVNQVDEGLPGTIYLSILSTALAKKTVVDLGTHTEPLNLYMSSILPSGERKSATMTVMTRPFIEYQKEQQCLLFVDDITPEKLGSEMSANSERLAILSSEGGIFDIMCGRYAKKIPNLDLFLKAHAGDVWSCSRIGRSDERMDSPALTICLTVQPEVIKMIGSVDQLRGRGLLARFLYSQCKPQAGFRRRQSIPVDDDLLTEYNDHIASLVSLPSFGSLPLSKRSQRIWDSFYDEVEMELRVNGKLYYFRDWGSKLSGAVARIAGLLHIAIHGEAADKRKIAPDTVLSAVSIGRYYMEHAIRTFELMGEDTAIEAAKKILEYIRRNEVTTFKGRDVLRGTGIRCMSDVLPGITVLIERSYIREAQVQYTGKGRPEGKVYVVNPMVHMD